MIIIGILMQVLNHYACANNEHLRKPFSVLAKPEKTASEYASLGLNESCQESYQDLKGSFISAFHWYRGAFRTQ